MKTFFTSKIVLLVVFATFSFSCKKAEIVPAETTYDSTEVSVDNATVTIDTTNISPDTTTPRRDTVTVPRE